MHVGNYGKNTNTNAKKYVIIIAFHNKNGYANASWYYVVRTWPLLLILPGQLASQHDPAIRLYVVWGNASFVKRYTESSTQRDTESGRGRLKCDGTRAETRFRLAAKRTSPFKSAGASVQSTTGSRVVRISGSNAGYTMFRGSVKGTGYPLHSPISPSLPLLCVTVCHHISTGVCRSQWPRGLRLRSHGRSPAGIVGSNPTRGMDICLLWVFCVVR